MLRIQLFFSFIFLINFLSVFFLLRNASISLITVLLKLFFSFFINSFFFVLERGLFLDPLRINSNCSRYYKCASLYCLNILKCLAANWINLSACFARARCAARSRVDKIEALAMWSFYHQMKKLLSVLVFLNYFC